MMKNELGGKNTAWFVAMRRKMCVYRKLENMRCEGKKNVPSLKS